MHISTLSQHQTHDLDIQFVYLFELASELRELSQHVRDGLLAMLLIVTRAHVHRLRTHLPITHHEDVVVLRDLRLPHLLLYRLVAQVVVHVVSCAVQGFVHLKNSVSQRNYE